MARNEDLGHEPEETHDRWFAPVNRGADARGRTVSPPGREETGLPRSGTGVPGVRNDHPDSGSADEQGVRRAEEHDATREH